MPYSDRSAKFACVCSGTTSTLVQIAEKILGAEILLVNVVGHPNDRDPPPSAEDVDGAAGMIAFIDADGKVRSITLSALVDGRTPVSLMQELTFDACRRRAVALGLDLDSLLVQVGEILLIDEIAAEPGRLETEVAAHANGEIDAEALANLIRRTPLHDPLPSARRARIEQALKIIRELRASDIRARRLVTRGP